MIRDDKDGGGGKRLFELLESGLVIGGPEPGDIFMSEGVQRSDDI